MSESTWQKLPPYTGTVHQGCALANSVKKLAPMDTMVAVGFGVAQITKDGIIVFDEHRSDEFHFLAEFEEMAKADPDHDWRLQLYGPLRGAEYQRQSDAEWVLINSDGGFA